LIKELLKNFWLELHLQLIYNLLSGFFVFYGLNMNSKLEFQLTAPGQIVAAIGASLAAVRLSRNVTQSALADEAGISVSTLKRLEHGDNPTLDSLVRVMTALKLVDNLALLVPDTSIRPLELASSKPPRRQRARKSNHVKPTTARPWTWGTS
jgi:transcriptional regulator with XRE-family HTH domain